MGSEMCIRDRNYPIFFSTISRSLASNNDVTGGRVNDACRVRLPIFELIFLCEGRAAENSKTRFELLRISSVTIG